MKKPFYLVGLAALALAGCSDNDFFSGGPDDNFGQASKGQLAFGISDGSGKTTRGEITGETAAKKLGEHFTVYGWKYVNANSDAAAEGFEDVFQDYVVKWQGVGSMGTTESNSRGWEYVGYQSEPVDGSTPYDQTIKYWDWSTDRYDFIAWSIANGNAQVLTRNVVPTSTKTTAAEPGLKFFAPTAKDLGGVFVSDKFTSRPENKDKGWAATDWTGFFNGGLANIESHPDPDNHRGKYSQIGTNVTADGEEGIVTLQFRNLAAKARIGIYETIPGYKVSNVVFYRQDAAEHTGDAPVGTTDYQTTWKVTDANGDYNANQSFATLYAKDATPANAKIFARRGEISVKYHDAYYNAEGTEKDNVAYTAVEGTDKESYFAFGKLTNERGSTTPIGTNEIGVTSNTASMSIGNDADNLYTYVFPMETNDHVLNLKVNYLLTSIDGSKENIRVTGANAVVPVEFAKWKPNYAYTYLFKISDNTNGQTGGTVGPAGLYPITFDACLVNTEDGMQQTITTVNDKSITTYQDGSEVTANNEYLKGKGDIYFTVEGAEGSNELHTIYSSGVVDVKLYTAWAADPSIITEEAVANYKANNIVLTDVTNVLSEATEATNSSGAQYSIKFAAGKALKFTPVAKYYVVKAEYTESSKTYISYKVIKIQDGSDAKTFTISDIADIPNNGSTTFNITNGASGSNGAVTGAKGAIKITNSSSEDVTDLFTISEADTPNPYTYTIKANAPDGTYTVSMGGTSKTIVVAAPKWESATVYVEEGKTATNVIKDKDGGAAMNGITPTVTPQSDAVGKLTASVSNESGVVTLSPAAGSYGEFEVAYHGGKFTVQVDKYELSVSPAIINAGDAEHKTATITLTNKNASGTGVNGKTVTIGTSHITETSLTTAGSGDATVNINAASTGTTKFTYNNASCEVEVVNYKIETSADLDEVRTIKLTKDGNPVNGATFTATNGATVQATSPIATPGIYKVTGTGATKISFKYKGVVVADIDLPAITSAP